MNLQTILGFLCFNAKAIRKIAGNKLATLAGFLFVISAGFAREYDGEYLFAEPWHLGIPVVASTFACLAMVVLVYWLAYVKQVRNVSFLKTYHSFLNLYWMTAPLAWLYAIPFERFLTAGDATRANLTLLAIVALWRVALMIRCVQVIYGAKLLTALVPVLLFSDVLMLLAFWLVPSPIIAIMGGVRLSDSENTILQARMLLGFLGGASLIIWIGLYFGLMKSKSYWRWCLTERDSAGETAISPGVWLVCASALLVWIPILPFTQSEQKLRWETEELLHSGEFKKLSKLIAEHQESDFPTHWDPPPRLGYGEDSPNVYEVTLGLISNDAPKWFINRYGHKLYEESIGWRFTYIQLSDLSDEDLKNYVLVISALENGPEIAKHQVENAKVLLNNSLTESRKKSLTALCDIGKSAASKMDANDN